jgi:hypothetical protein
MDDDKPRPNPGGDDGTDDNSGNSGLPLEWILAVVGAVVAIFAIASAIGLTVSNTSSSPPGQTTCGTSCYGFAKLECPGNRLMGACFGIWTCSNPDHKCGQDGRLKAPSPRQSVRRRDREAADAESDRARRGTRCCILQRASSRSYIAAALSRHQRRHASSRDGGDPTAGARRGVRPVATGRTRRRLDDLEVHFATSPPVASPPARSAGPSSMTDRPNRRRPCVRQ